MHLICSKIYLLFLPELFKMFPYYSLKYHLLFRSDSKKIIPTIDYTAIELKTLHKKYHIHNIEKVHKVIAELETKYFQYAL